MGLARHFRITAVLVLCKVLCEATAHAPRCGSEFSIFGKMLRRHIFKKIAASLGTECLKECNNDVRCQSFNYVISQHMCELNNRTKEARPEDFVPNFDRYYYGLVKRRVRLGSIPELPAVSCKEIKASEGGQAVSGRYWFDSITPGKTVLAYCDMEKEDIDECVSGIHNCPIDIASCKNTEGSYECACNHGYVGEGKSSCIDIDECVSGINDCLSDVASCKNTEGSYECACNHGYVGDGKTSCILVPECQSYTILTNGDRKTTHVTDDPVCDNQLGSGWYRFQGNAGTRMPTSCPSKKTCGTDAPGWLNGVHPAEADGKVTRQVCFHWSSSRCNWSTNIQVRNCGCYYVYYLRATPACSLRYCGTD